MLTASVDGIDHADGLENATFAYQWLSNDGAADTDIESATDSTYTLVAADAGTTVTVRVTYTDDGGTEVTLVSAATDPVAVAGSSELSVADAEASEEEDTALEFVVTLDPAAGGTVTVDYATADGTATAGDDYDSTSGTLTFEAGETTKTVSVPITADTEDDGGETLTLTLSNASGAGLGDVEATGTILNTGDAAGLSASVPESRFASTRHTGSDDRPQVVVTFSEAVAAFAKDTPSVQVTGGTAASVQAHSEDGLVNAYVFFVTPAGDGDVTFALVADAACASGGICTAGGTVLTQVPATVTIPGPDDAEEAADAAELTASFTDVPAEHDGQSVFTFRVEFSEDVGTSYQTLRDESFSVTDGDVTGARRVDGRHDLWEITVEPDSREAVTISLPGASACGTAGAVCTRGDDPRPLSNSPSATVAGPPADPLTASVSGMPSEHAGEGTFTFGLTFSENVTLSYKTLRDAAFSVSGGAVRKAQREQQGSNAAWEITVEPDSAGAVTIGLPETTDCDASGAICTADGRALSHSLSATVMGPVGISVADARVDENGGAPLAFAVTLSRATDSALTVDYATADGSAQAGVDYTAVSGTLTFQAGESSQTVNVTVLDDSHDDTEETLTLTLSNPSSGRLTDAEATGTIVNSDPLPRALLARFGRTAAVHVVEHVEERLQAPRAPGFKGRFAGREVRPGMEREMALSFLSQLGTSGGAYPAGGGLHDPLSGSGALARPELSGAAAPMGGMGGSPMGGMGAPRGGAAGPAGSMGAMSGPGPMDGMAGQGGGMAERGLLSMGLGGGNLLTGSAFALNRETRHGGILSFWSRGAQSSYYGREGALSLDGDVRTTMFGADYAKGPLVMGLSLANSRGLGSYAGETAGQMASSVTGLYPWLGYRATDRITVWGVTGYGSGGMLLTLGGGPTLESGLSMAMAAAGTRGELVAGGAGGFGLAFKADALWVGTASEEVDGPAGRLAAAHAAVTRFRAGLEGSRGFRFGSALSLTPSVEVGLRQDGGDADRGSGIDIGGGLVVSAPSTGLSADVRVRMLLVHQAEGFRDRGMAVSISWNPTPSTPLGLTARVAPSWGGQATGGAEALWGRQTMAGMAQDGVANGSRLDAEVGYGLPLGSRFVGTPRIGVAATEHGREYRLGYGLGVLDRESLNLELGVDAHRRESPTLDGTDNGFLGRATLGW